MKRLIVPALIAAGLTLAGCGSSGPPPSAARACRDYAVWYDANDGLGTRDMKALDAAYAAAPNGQLREDIGAVQAATSRGQVPDAGVVLADCQSAGS